MLYRKIEKEIKEHLENNANTIGASQTHYTCKNKHGVIGASQTHYTCKNKIFETHHNMVEISLRCFNL